MLTNDAHKQFLAAFFGGDQPMRYVFIDEAGTSERESVTIVVGIIANADEHVMSAEALVHEILGAVPAKLKPDFVFHAMQVYGDKKYQEAEWSLTDRLDLLYEMMGVPRKIGMAISLAVQWRGAVDFSETFGKLGMSPEQSDHFSAFNHCIGIADRNIRKHAGSQEIATVVAEDVPEMRKYLRKVPKLLRENPYSMPQKFMRKTIADEEAGYISQKGDLRVTRIRNSVHFVEKSEDPLVQVADACAYGFRRFFAGEKFGLEFVRAIIENESAIRNFASPGGVECFWPKT